MTEIFVKLLNMSITAGWLILAVIVLRASLRKMPKWGRCILWALVAVRLVLPFSIESMFSLIPTAEPLSPEILYSDEASKGNTEIPAANKAENYAFGDTYRPVEVHEVNIKQVLTQRAAYLWFGGMICMLLYALISYLRLHKRVRLSVRYYDTVQYYDAIQRHGSVWICDEIDTPFILGVIKPRVYLPSNLEEIQLQYVLAHENIHLKRRDHWWKPFGFLILSVYWFQPLIWVAYILLCRDIELACDESVVKNYELEDKKAYSNALLTCSAKRRLIAACPIAFGEVGVKERVKGVLNYKKPSFWIVLVTVLLCITGMVCFLTNPVQKVSSGLETTVSKAILEREEGGYQSGEFACESHEVLAVKNKGNRTTVYALVLYREYSRKNGEIVHESGSYMPTALSFDKNAEEYLLEEYWIPKDGSYYADSIREKFPVGTWLRVHNMDRYLEKLSADCLAQAEEWFAAQYEKDGEPETEIPTTEAPTETEKKLLPLSELAVDLTGDGVKDKIVITGYGANEEEVRRYIWNASYGEVTVYDGADEDKIYYNMEFSGSHVGNGNLAVVKYNGENCLLYYDNTIYSGIGSFGYQVIRLPRQGMETTEEVLAENSVSYAFESLPYAEGTPLLESEEAYEGIKKIVAELDELLLADSTTILVNASVNGNCYFYEPDKGRRQSGYDAFCQSIGGTGNNIDEWFDDYRKQRDAENAQQTFNTTPDEYGFYDYLPASYYEDAYAKARTCYGEDFLKDYELVSTQKADISKAAGTERIEVYTSEQGAGVGGFVIIKSEDGKILYSEEANYSRAGWNNIYLGNADGQDYILIFYNENRDTYGAYGYCVYRLTEGGGIIVRDCAGMEWGNDYTYDDERFKEWADSLSYYMMNSKLLLSSQDGILRTEQGCEADKYTYETLKPYETYETY